MSRTYPNRTQVNSHTTNDLNAWNSNHKQVKDIEKEDQKLMIHFQTHWELYQNICSKPTIHSYKPIMKPKATSTPLFPLLFAFSAFLLFSVTHAVAPVLSFRKKEFPNRPVTTAKQTRYIQPTKQAGEYRKHSMWQQKPSKNNQCVPFNRHF